MKTAAIILDFLAVAPFVVAILLLGNAFGRDRGPVEKADYKTWAAAWFAIGLLLIYIAYWLRYLG